MPILKSHSMIAHHLNGATEQLANAENELRKAIAELDKHRLPQHHAEVRVCVEDLANQAALLSRLAGVQRGIVARVLLGETKKPSGATMVTPPPIRT